MRVKFAKFGQAIRIGSRTEISVYADSKTEIILKGASLHITAGSEQTYVPLGNVACFTPFSEEELEGHRQTGSPEGTAKKVKK